jgi:hypothetical protein
MPSRKDRRRRPSRDRNKRDHDVTSFFGLTSAAMATAEAHRDTPAVVPVGRSARTHRRARRPVYRKHGDAVRGPRQSRAARLRHRADLRTPTGVGETSVDVFNELIRVGQIPRSFGLKFSISGRLREPRTAAPAAQCTSNPSPVGVSRKRELFNERPETFGIFSRQVRKLGGWRPTTELQKRVIGGLFCDRLRPNRGRPECLLATQC